MKQYIKPKMTVVPYPRISRLRVEIAASRFRNSVVYRNSLATE